MVFPLKKSINPFGGETKVHSFNHPLEGKVEQAGQASLRIQRPLLDSGAQDAKSGLLPGIRYRRSSRCLMQPMAPRQDALFGSAERKRQPAGGKSAEL